MVVKEKKGNIYTLAPHSKYVDWLQLEWHETAKRIMHKRTNAGRELVLKFMGEAQLLSQGDILFEDEGVIIAVDIIPANAIVIHPLDMYEMAAVCYEIGNKHLPLFYERETLLVPFDMPLFRLLTAQGYNIKQEERKLLHSIKTTVTPHGSSQNSETIFSKIMKLTGSQAQVK